MCSKPSIPPPPPPPPPLPPPPTAAKVKKQQPAAAQSGAPAGATGSTPRGFGALRIERNSGVNSQ